jgi:hypothetical protein
MTLAEKEEFLRELQEKLRKENVVMDEHQLPPPTANLMNIDVSSDEAFDKLIDVLMYYIYMEMKMIRQDYYERGKADGFKSAIVSTNREDID